MTILLVFSVLVLAEAAPSKFEKRNLVAEAIFILHEKKICSKEDQIGEYSYLVKCVMNVKEKFEHVDKKFRQLQRYDHTKAFQRQMELSVNSTLLTEIISALYDEVTTNERYNMYNISILKWGSTFGAEFAVSALQYIDMTLDKYIKVGMPSNTNNDDNQTLFVGALDRITKYLLRYYNLDFKNVTQLWKKTSNTKVEQLQLVRYYNENPGELPREMCSKQYNEAEEGYLYECMLKINNTYENIKKIFQQYEKVGEKVEAIERQRNLTAKAAFLLHTSNMIYIVVEEKHKNITFSFVARVLVFEYTLMTLTRIEETLSKYKKEEGIPPLQLQDIYIKNMEFILERLLTYYQEDLKDINPQSTFRDTEEIPTTTSADMEAIRKLFWPSWDNTNFFVNLNKLLMPFWHNVQSKLDKITTTQAPEQIRNRDQNEPSKNEGCFWKMGLCFANSMCDNGIPSMLGKPCYCRKLQYNNDTKMYEPYVPEDFQEMIVHLTLDEDIPLSLNKKLLPGEPQGPLRFGPGECVCENC